jgi:hypothetical protein
LSNNPSTTTNTSEAGKHVTFCAVISMDQAPGYAVGWGSLALINAGLAQGKNRGGLNWFLISLLLGPIATFLIVLIDKLPDQP